MNKVINCGETLSQAVDKVTRRPAENFRLKDLGVIKEGCIADLCIFRFEDCDEEVLDANGNKLRLRKKIVPEKLVISRGGESEIL